MPQRIFSGSNFEIGFYSFVITLVFSLVGSLGAGILGIVPILGGLAGLVFAIGLAAMACLCSVRMAMKQRIGEGFQLQQVWTAIMRSPWSFLAAALLPVVAACVLVMAVTTLGGVLGMGTMVPLVFVSADIAALLFVLAATFVGLALYVVCCILVMTAMLVADRALAHWVGRYASEWTM